MRVCARNTDRYAVSYVMSGEKNIHTCRTYLCSHPLYIVRGSKRGSMDLGNAYDKIYRYVYFKMKERTIAEDITQETFLRVISQKGSLHDYEIRYLYTVARNLCVDEYRRVRPDCLPEEYEGVASAQDDSLEERLAVRAAVKKLPAEDQEILLLRYVNEESARTISNALGISRFALYRRLKNAEDKLRESLEADDHEN